ncbi:MAG: EamA family transporter [Clostridia bacterium]|nr:EamA family transporter [Clostridia bacterium]
MGYLLLAIASSAMVAVIMRLSTDRIKGNASMLALNYLMCAALGGAYALHGQGLAAGSGAGAALGMGAFNGALYLGSFMLMQWNTKNSGVVLTNVFMKLGLLVPMAVSVAVFGERAQVQQIVGFLIAIGAIFLINMEPRGEKMRFNWALAALLLAGGSADAMSKVFEQTGAAQYADLFLFCTFAAALLLCVALAAAKKEKPGLAEIGFGLLIGIPNFFSSKFLLLSLGSVPAVIAYPTYSVATLMTVTLAGVCFFKEKLGKRQWIALGVILVALVLLNI